VFVLRVTAVAAAVVAAVSAFVPAALAKNGDPQVRGTCTASSTTKLKLKNENGRIEVEFEVDQNRNGVPWRVTLRRNGTSLASMTAVTRAPSGSFTVHRVIANAPGADRVNATATSPSGERCTTRATF
jgi:hypothetical protein